MVAIAGRSTRAVTGAGAGVIRPGSGASARPRARAGSATVENAQLVGHLVAANASSRDCRMATAAS